MATHSSLCLTLHFHHLPTPTGLTVGMQKACEHICTSLRFYVLWGAIFPGLWRRWPVHPPGPLCRQVLLM